MPGTGDGGEARGVQVSSCALPASLERFGRDNVLILDVGEYFSNRRPVLERVQQFLDLPVVEIPQFQEKINENPLRLEPADEASRTLLASFYRSYNDKLYELLGREFPWYAG